MTSSPSLVLAANPSRLQALFINTGNVTAFLGQAGVTTTTGIPVLPQGNFVDDASNSEWDGVTASGSTSFVIVEVA